MTVQVRQARPDEAKALTELVLLSKQSNGYDDAFIVQCVDELTVTEARISSEVFLVADDGNKVLTGCASLLVGADGKDAEIRTFFVAPDRKRQGIGRLLWSGLLGHARSLALTGLYLDADPAAVPFYESLGFRVVGENPSGSIPGRFIPHMKLLDEVLTQEENQ
jgi:N-acetylglutamate synthase-like GNAT family acetyltransferase